MKKRKSPPAALVQVNNSLLLTAYALHQQGRLDQAEKLYREILRTQPGHLDVLQLLARIALQKKDTAIALELFNRILKISPDDSSAFCNRANIFFALKRFEEALASYDRALQIKPDDADALCNRGTVLVALDRHEAAVASYDQAIALSPNHAEAFNSRGSALARLNRPAEALASYNRALAFRPDHAEALYNRGNVLFDLKCYEKALASYDQALAFRPDYAEALSNRGHSLCLLNFYKEALASCELALNLQPDFASAFVNRGCALLGMNRLEEALVSCDQAIKLKPDHADAFVSRGNVFLVMNRHEEALADYGQAQKIKPDCAEALWNEAWCRLLLGDFAIGWRKYEWRWKTSQIARDFRQPLWLGETSLLGKTILLHAEQGFGDTLQFCRYAPMIAALGVKVLLGVQPALKTLCQSLAGVDLLLGKGEALPDFDLHTPLLSLPLALGTRLETIPAEVPYLHAEPDKISAWQELLGPKARPRVGLAWRGRPTHNNDHNRTLAFAALFGLFEAPLEFVCLQKDFRDQAEEQACRQAGLRIFNEQLNDFADTAALVMALDLVITVDTSIAHLVGALGKPVWILLPFAPDFRWLLERGDSPWYPSARLFRQQKTGQWDVVLAEVGAELEEWNKANGKS